MSTLVGEAAVDEVLNAQPDTPARMIGMKGNRVTRLLMECVEKTHAINDAIRERNFPRAMELRKTRFSGVLSDSAHDGARASTPAQA